MRVRYTEAALADLEGIFEYLALRNPAAAARVVQHVEQLIARLTEFPELGHATDERGVRIVPVGRFP